MSAELFEQQYVTETYEKIANEFSETRFTVWSEVFMFINSFPEDALLADIGCGNGKNIIRSNMIGVDNCQSFVDICNAKKLNVSKGSILSIPLLDNTYDGVICIAVLHHLSTTQRRRDAIAELIRITKSGGKILITTWAEIGYKSSHRVETLNGNDKLIGWKKTNQRYYHFFEKDELDSLVTDMPVKVVLSGYERKNWWICLQKI